MSIEANASFEALVSVGLVMSMRSFEYTYVKSFVSIEAFVSVGSFVSIEVFVFIESCLSVRSFVSVRSSVSIEAFVSVGSFCVSKAFHYCDKDGIRIIKITCLIFYGSPSKY